ncbi:Hypothetical protein PENO1_008920 [Penicillium occitanis (nom. inval.)]|nr:Hypothetical protein PENO1_008920 [Penicillium occitanis (nom. inval.)]PCH10031.1 hypothetical protein PENOC_005560 [Penicillium occitanis (nom. inval.)]
MEDTKEHSMLNISRQLNVNPLDNSSSCEPPTGIGFLDLPYELRLMIYHYSIPRNYQITVNCNLRSCVRWKNDQSLDERTHSFLSILLVSKQVSEESLNVLYGDNSFVCQWDLDAARKSVPLKYGSYEGDCPYENESIMDLFLSIFTAKNRDRIRQLRYIVVYWGMPYSRTSCSIFDASTARLSIRFWLLANKKYIDSQIPFPEDFWEDVFDILEVILVEMRPQLNTIKVSIDADPPIDGKSIEIVLRRLSMYLPLGYDLEICEKEESVDD